MADNLSGGLSRRIDREALERIIQRAAELQAGELDTGDAMTESELLKLGADVGIDGRFLRQALYEESAGPRALEKGVVARWFGPGAVSAGRVVPGDKAAVEQALAHWMTEGEALAVKRRMADRTIWERQKGFFAEMKRGFGVGGKSYMLAKAHDVTVVVTQLEAGFSHAEISADMRERRNGIATATGVSAGALGAVGVAVLTLLSVPLFGLVVIGGVPLAAAAVAPLLASRTQRRFAATMHLALEQVLDRLEHGEIKPRHQELGKGWGGLFGIADEIKRTIGEQQQRRLKP